MTFDTGQLLELTYFAGVVLAASIYLRSTLSKQRTTELEELASTRGQRIDDLERKVEVLSEHISKLEGQIDMLTALKTDAIIDGVVPRVVSELRPFLTAE